MRILLIEDSKRLAGSIRSGLCKLGHAVDLAFDGKAGLSYALHNPYDVVVLDLMLPEMDGLEVLKRIRDEGNETRVLVLTARRTVDDRVRGLQAGADDYLVKPFSFDELAARVEALGRRKLGSSSPRLVVGDLIIETAARRVTFAGKQIPLTAREYNLLLLLMSHHGKPVTRTEIEDHLYDERTFPMSNAVETAISRLRARLAEAGGKNLIQTRRGFGYVLEETSP